MRDRRARTLWAVQASTQGVSPPCLLSPDESLHSKVEVQHGPYLNLSLWIGDQGQGWKVMVPVSSQLQDRGLCPL